MKNIKMVILLVIILVFGLLSTGCMFNFGIADALRFKKYNINEEETIEIDNIDDIVVVSLASKINFHESKNSNVRVHLHGTLKSNFEPELIIDKKSDKVEIRTEKKSFKDKSTRDNKLILDIYLPSNYNNNLNVSAVSGDIILRDFKFDDLELSAVSGNIDIDNIEAEYVTTNTVSGDVKGNNIQANDEFKHNSVSGEMEISDIETDDLSSNTVSGRIILIDFNTDNANLITISGRVELRGSIGSADVDTTSGDVIIETSRLEGDIDINAVSGDIKLDIPKNADFEFTADTVSGTLDTEFEFSNIKIDKNKLQGTKGSGKYKIDIDTVSGDIEIY